MKTLEFRDDSLFLLDQTRLPLESVQIECADYETLCEAIRRLSIRGAPAIGLAAGYGVVLAARELSQAGLRGEELRAGIRQAMAALRATRPTAINLFWALDRMKGLLATLPADVEPDELVAGLLKEADAMLREDEAANRRMAIHGAELIPDGANVLTHCNAGALAAGAYGMAVGVLRNAHEQGKTIHVWVDETRPLLQGSRLTAWELQQAKIPYTIITDSMAGHFMARGQIDAAVVGADRIVANGDAANKIGTYTVATLAAAHGIPMYFVAPTSSIDLSTPSGDLIPIEERKAEEVLAFGEFRTGPAGAHVANPAFDVTPARLITAIVTEYGIIRAPFEEGLREAVAQATAAPETP